MEPLPAPTESARPARRLLVVTAAILVATFALESRGIFAALVAPRPVTPLRPPPPGNDDALDLGSAVLPVLLKSYGKQAAAGLGVLLVLLWIRRLLRS